MHLFFNYKSNETAIGLLEYLTNNWEMVNHRQINIEGDIYLELSVHSGSDNVIFTINDSRAITNSLSIENIKQILKFNNLMVEQSGELINRTYNVLVYESSIISIKQTIFGKNGNQSKYVGEDAYKKISEMAIRAIYLLGLDYGMVDIVITGQRKVKVSSIDASPEIRERDMQVIIKRLTRLLNNQQYDTHKEVKLGADPEFMISNSKNGKMIAASEFFPREGVVGCDNIRIPSRQQRPVAELRPRPDVSPLGLLANIKQAMNSANRLVPYRNVKWVAGSHFSGYSIGGHIHFSNVDYNNRLIRALDTYVGLPVFLIENQETATKRRRRYGSLADCRDKDYGGFEYRTPGSWLVSEEIATAVLCLAKIVASNYLLLTKNCFITPEGHKAFYEGDQDYLKPYFCAAWKDIECLEMYDVYKDHIKIIPEMIKAGMNWDEKKDIRKTWTINPVPNRNYNGSRNVTNATYTVSNSNRPISTGSSSVSRNPSSITGRSRSISSNAGNRRVVSSSPRISVSGPVNIRNSR